MTKKSRATKEIQEEKRSKPAVGFIPPDIIREMGKTLSDGAEKYGAYDFTKGVSVTERLHSLGRHLEDLKEGVDIVPDSPSGAHTCGAIAINAAIILYMLRHRPEFDDRGFKHD